MRLPGDDYGYNYNFYNYNYDNDDYNYDYDDYNSDDKSNDKPEEFEEENYILIKEDHNYEIK